MVIKTQENSADHLDNYQLSLAAEALIENQFAQLDYSIKIHLENCEVCANHLLELSDAVTAPIKHPTKTSTKKIYWGWWVAAASILLALLSGVTAWNYRQDNENLANENRDWKNHLDSLLNSKKSVNPEIPSPQKETQTVQSTAKDSLQQLQKRNEKLNAALASLYSPNEDLENEMRLSLRSGELELLSPIKKKYTQNSKIVFKWKGSPSALSLAIYNNRGLRVLSTKKIATKHELTLKQLGIGTFYYQLFWDKDLVSMNKFSIK